MKTSMTWGSGLRGSFRRISCRLSARRFVFVYHRIAEPAHDPWNLAVAPARFEEQLQVLRAHGAVMPLERMLRELDAGTLPPRAAALTFDDGYADTLLAAKPLLDRYDVPASVYLSPGLLDGRTSFWWDSLARIVFEPALLPRHLDIRLGDERVMWKAEIAGAASPRTATAQAPMADELCALPSAQRRALHLKLWAPLRRMSHEAQRPALAELSAWAGGESLDDARERPLTRTEAAQLAEDGLIEIAAHGMTHASLPTCDPARQRAEIEGSKTACEEIAGARVESFSYPYGDHDRAAARLVREAGFTSAFTTSARPLSRSADRLRLPRIPALDWGGAELERCLARTDFA